MLIPWRRHLKACPHRKRAVTKCTCPIWVDGEVNGKRFRKSMGTRDWARAMKDLAKMEDPAYGLRECVQPGCPELLKERGRCDRHRRTVTAAIAAFHDAHQDVCEDTKRNRRRSLRLLEEFLTGLDVCTVDQINLDALNTFRTTRRLSPRSWTKELEILRHFLRFCLDNEWVFRNWAEKVQMPRNLKPASREPYQPNEIARIIAACDQFGRTAYERLRARAVVLLLRYTALRIGDVTVLRKDRIRHGEILIRTAKNGKPVKLPVHPDLQAALDVLPVPRGAASPDCPYFFWSGNGDPRAAKRDVSRTMQTVYQASGVAKADSHRFRHTLVTEILEMGGSHGEAADILGDSEAIIRKYYAKWSAGRQARITDLLARLWHTSAPEQSTLQQRARHVYGTRENSDAQVAQNDKYGLVDGMGFEPTTPALRTPCSPS